MEPPPPDGGSPWNERQSGAIHALGERCYMAYANFSMDPFRFAIATIPLAAWLAVMGYVNLRQRPLLTTGTSDLLALGLAMSGFVFVGPVALFRPEAATIQFGNYIWLFMMGFYWLWVALASMTMRPRIIAYNMTPERLRPLVAEAAAALDPSFRWAADTLVLPTLGVQLHIEGYRLLRNTSLVASGSKQNLQGWSLLANDLRVRLRYYKTEPLMPAALLLIAAAVLIAMSTISLTSDPLAVAEAQRDIFAFGPRS